MSQSVISKSESMASKAKSKKRTRTEDGESRKKRKSRHEQDDSLLDMDRGLNTGFAFMDSQLLSDSLAQKATRFGTDLSPVELADLYISPNSIQDTTSWQEPRTLEKLPDFLEKFTNEPERLARAPKKKGSPHTIIVAGAGLRAADIVRAVRKFQTKDNSVAKLVCIMSSEWAFPYEYSEADLFVQFAKHIKLDEAAKFLQEHRTGIAVGTPTRLNDLIENGALSLDKLERIVVDASHIDQKKRGILDMKEITMPLTRWLARSEFKERYAATEKPLQLLFY